MSLRKHSNLPLCAIEGCDRRVLRKTRKYCSIECRGIAQRNRVTLTCVQCGKIFQCRPCEAKNGRSYCSQRCFLIVRNPLEQRPPTKICPVCDEYIEGYHTKTQTYCSNSCSARATQPWLATTKILSTQVRAIRQAFANGDRAIDIATRYGISDGTVHDIVKRRIRKSVQ